MEPVRGAALFRPIKRPFSGHISPRATPTRSSRSSAERYADSESAKFGGANFAPFIGHFPGISARATPTRSPRSSAGSTVGLRISIAEVETQISVVPRLGVREVRRNPPKSGYFRTFALKAAGNRRNPNRPSGLIPGYFALKCAEIARELNKMGLLTCKKKVKVGTPIWKLCFAADARLGYMSGVEYEPD